ncbi:50S ribosomal protein L10 [Candidatus Woesebacteria bacterium]|nr:MAG: 50S ribosomal protein L10 [Candidatus Woesebacteria bacterium]
MNKVSKEKFVSDLAKEIKAASCVVLVDYMGLTVKLQQALKSELSKVNATMVVVKNTLFKLAAEKADAPKETTDTALVGPTAMVITTGDPIAPLQVLGKFSKVNELPQFKIGIVENVFQNSETLLKLSTLPGKDALFAQALGAIAAPLYGIVGTLNAPMQKLVYVLSEAAKGGDNS